MRGSLTGKYIEELRADRKRLEFLEHDAAEVQGQSERTVNLGIWRIGGRTLRQAIDAAMVESSLNCPNCGRLVCIVPLDSDPTNVAGMCDPCGSSWDLEDLVRK